MSNSTYLFCNMKNHPLGDARQNREAMMEEMRDQKRERILAVAEELFFQRGYAGTTMSDIVEQLGVAKPYLYYYFNNKAEIYETLTLRSSHACLTAMHFEASDARPAVEKLREGLQRFATANVLYFKSGTFAYRESATRHPEVDREVRGLARGFYKELRCLLDQGRQDGDLDFEDTKLTAFAIGSIAGFLYTWYKPDGPTAPEDMAAQLTTILLRIAGARSQAARPRRRPSSR